MVQLHLGPIRIRGRSSAGRTPGLQPGGQRFDPARLHSTLSIFTDKVEYEVEFLKHRSLTIKCIFYFFCENIFSPDNKGAQGIPWHCKAMKDASGGDMPRGAVKEALIRGFPNGGTHLE